MLFSILVCRDLPGRGVFMLLDLKDVFLNEGAHHIADYTIDLSLVEVDGVKPMPKPVSIKADAVNTAGVVKLVVNAEFLYSRPCDRCLLPVERDMSLVFEHVLVVSLSGDNDDDSYIEVPNYMLNLDELVTSDIVLGLPLKYLCKDDCKGLCQNCGINLNYSDCSCVKNTTDPRFDILKQLLD